MTPPFELDWLKRWAQYSPANVALQDADTGEKISYAGFYEISNRIARRLREAHGIARGDRVAVLATNELETVLLFFAIQRLGAILVPINFRLTAPEIAHILQDSSPKLLIHQRQYTELLSRIPSGSLPPRLLHFDPFDGAESLVTMARDPRLPAEPLQMEAREEDPCMILYTSGTTGSPKGAIITPKTLFWNSLNTSLRLNLTQSDVNLSFLPLFHTGGWNVLVTPLIHRGGRTVLLKRFDPDRVLELADTEGLTILFGVPTMMDMMARSKIFAKASLKSVRFAIVGGEPMPLELIRTWENMGISIRQGYGLTEFGPNVFSLNQEDSIRKIGSIGFANFYIDTRIVTDNGQEACTNEVGELWLHGPACTPGYWNNPDATAEAIQDGWLRTGDLVRKDEEGYHYVVGRKKDMFISGGENVYPAEIERFLRTNPKIHEAAVIGVPDSKWGEVGKAFVSLAAGASMAERELLDYCAGQLAKYKIPKTVTFLAELPKGDSGKILKRALKEI